MIALAATSGCDNPSEPSPEAEVSGFTIDRAGNEVYSYHPANFSFSDTFRVAARDSMPVEFVWLDETGEEVTIGKTGAEMLVTTSPMSVLRWRPDASDPFRGSFVGGDLLQPITAIFRVELESDGDVILLSPQLAAKVSP